MSKQTWIGILILVLFGGGAFLLRSLSNKTPVSELPVRTPNETAVFPSPPLTAVTPTPIISPAASSSASSTSAEVAEFKDALEKLETKKNPAGKIISVRGKLPLGSSTPKLVLENFLKSQGIANLTFKSDLPPTMVGESAQYSFLQTVDGLSLFPPIGMSFIIEAQELRAIDADYVENVQVEGTRPATVPDGSTLVVYYDRQEGRTVGTYVYKTVKDGVTKLTDPVTGKVRYEKSNRQY